MTGASGFIPAPIPGTPAPGMTGSGMGMFIGGAGNGLPAVGIAPFMGIAGTTGLMPGCICGWGKTGYWVLGDIVNCGAARAKWSEMKKR